MGPIITLILPDLEADDVINMQNIYLLRQLVCKFLKVLPYNDTKRIENSVVIDQRVPSASTSSGCTPINCHRPFRSPSHKVGEWKRSDLYERTLSGPDIVMTPRTAPTPRSPELNAVTRGPPVPPYPAPLELSPRDSACGERSGPCPTSSTPVAPLEPNIRCFS